MRIVERWQDANGTRTVAVEVEVLPLSSAWLYVPPEVAYRVSPSLQGAYETASADPNALEACNASDAYTGWEFRGGADAREIAAADLVWIKS